MEKIQEEEKGREKRRFMNKTRENGIKLPRDLLVNTLQVQLLIGTSHVSQIVPSN